MIQSGDPGDRFFLCYPHTHDGLLYYTTVLYVTLLHSYVGYGFIYCLQDEQGDTPIHDAITAKNNSGVAFLCAAPNINLKICNKKGLSPLHLAAMKDDEL